MKTNIFKLFFLSLSIIALSSQVYAQSDANDKTVVATVGEKTFYLSDLKMLHESNPQLKMIPMEAIYDNLLDHLIDGYLVTQKARKQGLEKDAGVKEAMRHAEDLILRNVYVQKEVSDRLAKKDLKEIYNDFVKNNPPSEQVRARHILVKTEDEAKQIIKELSNGADFVELAKTKSTGPSAPMGGDLGFFPKEAMVPEFADAAFAMKIGETSKTPVKSQFGWHVIKVEERKMAEVPSMKEIEPQLKTDYAEQVIEEILKELRSNEKIKRFDIKGKAK